MTDDWEMTTEYRKELKEEWKYLYHNASLLHFHLKHPLRNAYEEELWEVWLQYEVVEVFCEQLAQEVKEKFDRQYTFGQWGRGGATIAPNELMTDRTWGGIALNGDACDEKTLEILQYTTQRVEEEIAGLEEDYIEWKEELGLEKDILDHDGMHKIQVNKWVKDD